MGAETEGGMAGDEGVDGGVVWEERESMHGEASLH